MHLFALFYILIDTLILIIVLISYQCNAIEIVCILLDFYPRHIVHIHRKKIGGNYS